MMSNSKCMSIGGYRMNKIVYIDGANVIHVNNKTIRASRLETACDGMQKYGLKAHILLPNYILKKVDSPEIINKMTGEGKLSLISNNNDDVLITIAYEKDAFILTNDRFEDHKKKEWWTPEIDEWSKTKLITFDFIKEDISIPLSIRQRLKIHLNDSPISPMSVSDFKGHATNGGVPSSKSFESLPNPVQTILELISQNPNEMTLAALGTRLKDMTDYRLNDIFGKAKHAARFLKSRGYEVRQDKGDFYVKRVIA